MIAARCLVLLVAAHPRNPLVSPKLEGCEGGPRACHVRRQWAFSEMLAVAMVFFGRLATRRWAPQPVLECARNDEKLAEWKQPQLLVWADQR